MVTLIFEFYDVPARDKPTSNIPSNNTIIEPIRSNKFAIRQGAVRVIDYIERTIRLANIGNVQPQSSYFVS